MAVQHRRLGRSMMAPLSEISGDGFMDVIEAMIGTRLLRPACRARADRGPPLGHRPGASASAAWKQVRSEHPPNYRIK
jgi:hypothetical protein